MNAWSQLAANVAERLERYAERLIDMSPGEALPVLIVLMLPLLLIAWTRLRSRVSGDDDEAATERQVHALIGRNEYARAGELRMSQGQFEKALALFLNSDNHPKAALCYLALKQPGKAAEMYLKMGRHAEAAHYFQTAGAWKEAAECLHTLGSEREAAELFERAGELAKAANLLRSLGDAENAARLFERAGLGAEAAAALLEARGREPQALRRAGELFQSAGQLRRAGECLAAAGDWLQAAEMFEEGGELTLAAQAFEHSSAWGRAGAAYEQAAAFPEARANYERAGDIVRASQMALEMGKLLDAGRGFYQLGSYDRAIEILQGIPTESPEARQATLLLGRIFLEKGLAGRAREKLERIAPSTPQGKDDLEVLTYLADAYERSGDFMSAVTTLERITSVDEQFGNASERLERLQERAGGETNPPPGYYDSRYELQDEIGRGGMGVVYKAYDRELGRVVAIKFLSGQLAINAAAAQLFRQEARASAAMNHPNIVHVYDVGVIADRPCLVMEYVKGKTVREIMKGQHGKRVHAFSARRIAAIARETCQALEYAHAHNVIHRDIKPGNILISEDGQVKLMDFGISKVLETGPEGQTQAKGTPQYMPPEQILGRNVDARTDLYALGISMFEMATGRRPFGGEDVVDQQLHRPIPDPRDLRPDLPPGLVRIIRLACEKDPAERFASAAEMARALDGLLGEESPTD